MYKVNLNYVYIIEHNQQSTIYKKTILKIKKYNQ